ncbi:hypothetical protein M758_11G149200 [Ceratodon purpureus]|uniref:F-box domain-containing protein n=1 Tax=Ceratodon purpureus TaxID=3225 RepID=A0A8T0GGR3_CERPU|nr:hypothetical protein KC19_11G153300 [Ceratodon purpureus]KAG0601936.1 hypothetical protein M758_11G149200 [Ceratodon purpureus]
MAKLTGEQGKGSGEEMDAELWGSLQRYIGLEKVYTKLPFREFFQLRLVCKEWNRLAGDRAFLEETYKDFILPEPYFVLDAEGPDDKVRGLLARDGRTKLWTWTRLPNGNEFWSVAGLALSNVLKSKDEAERFVFNLHTRNKFTLPPPIEQTLQLRPYSGMEVDTSVRPYAYKLMQGNDDAITQIYDSRTNTWTAKNSHQYGMSPGKAIAAFAKGVLFIRCELDEIVIYDTARDAWDGINPPPNGDSDDFLRGIGAWQDRIFHPSVNPKQKVIRVWELTNLAEEEWTEVDTMPGELYSWLFYENSNPPVDYRDVQILASYCKEWILIYAWWIDDEEMIARGERFVMFNLVTKIWEKLELPFGPLGEHFPSQGELYAIS